MEMPQLLPLFLVECMQSRDVKWICLQILYDIHVIAKISLFVYVKLCLHLLLANHARNSQLCWVSQNVDGICDRQWKCAYFGPRIPVPLGFSAVMSKNHVILSTETDHTCRMTQLQIEIHTLFLCSLLMVRNFCLLVVSSSSPPTVSTPLCHLPTLPSPLLIHPHFSLFIHQIQPISSSFPSPSTPWASGFIYRLLHRNN